MSGLATISLFHTMGRWWARRTASRKVPRVVGSLSDWACFLRNNHHRISFSVESGVFGTLSSHANFSIAFMVSSDGVSVVSSFAFPLTISSLTFRNAIQHKGFTWPEKHHVLSAPLSAWNAGRAAVLASPRA